MRQNHGGGPVLVVLGILLIAGPLLIFFFWTNLAWTVTFGVQNPQYE